MHSKTDMELIMAHHTNNDANNDLTFSVSLNCGFGGGLTTCASSTMFLMVPATMHGNVCRLIHIYIAHRTGILLTHNAVKYRQ